MLQFTLILYWIWVLQSQRRGNANVEIQFELQKPIANGILKLFFNLGQIS